MHLEAETTEMPQLALTGWYMHTLCVLFASVLVSILEAVYDGAMQCVEVHARVCDPARRSVM